MDTTITSRESLEKYIWEIVHSTPATDMFTLMSPLTEDGLLPMGIDRLLTNRDLIAEMMRTSPVAEEEWSCLSLTEQVNHIWQTLFLDNSPVSEAARNVLTTLGMLDHQDLDPGRRDLDTYRAWFNAQNPVTHLNYILDRANLSSLVLLVDPFSPIRLAEPIRSNQRIHTALSLTPLLSDWKDLSGLLKEQGVIKKKTADPASLSAIGDWIRRCCEDTQAAYLTVTFPVDFDPAATTKQAALFNDCILATAREELIPLLISAPDWQDHSFLEIMKNLCSLHSDVEFLTSTEGRGNIRELCSTVNQQANLTLFGPCHWSNNPKCMTDDHRLFLELLGLNSIPVASGAQTLEELLGRWAHGRWILGRCLQEEYRRLWRTGWRPTQEEVERDIARLLNDNFWNLSNPVIEEVSADETEEEA